MEGVLRVSGGDSGNGGDLRKSGKKGAKYRQNLSFKHFRSINVFMKWDFFSQKKKRKAKNQKNDFCQKNVGGGGVGKNTCFLMFLGITRRGVNRFG